MWIVKKDHTEGKVIEVQIMSVDYDQVEAMTDDSEPNDFKMFDDDGILYYEGIFYGDASSEDGFRPLDDYGKPNAGCTYIQYKNVKGEWETL